MILHIIFAFCLIAWSPATAFVVKARPLRAAHRQAPTTQRDTTSLAMSLSLYGSPGSRSPLINWALYELDLDFTMGNLSENPHPFGQIPCLTNNDNDVMVFESGAILLYLNSLSSQNLNEAQTAQVMSWVAWANASLDPICFLETPDGKVCVAYCS